MTRILQEFGERPDAADALLPLVYEQLRAIAQRRMSDERSGHTLQATALVHEAYLRLVGDGANWRSRAHFYGAAGEAMRRLLIDHARKRRSLKRGGGRPPALVNVIDLAAEPDPEQVFAIDDAMHRLENEDARAAEVIRLRFFAGLSVEDTAAAMEVSRRTVMREWAYARARLYQFLSTEK